MAAVKHMIKVNKRRAIQLLLILLLLPHSLHFVLNHLNIFVLLKLLFHVEGLRCLESVWAWTGAGRVLSTQHMVHFFHSFLYQQLASLPEVVLHLANFVFDLV